MGDLFKIAVQHVSVALLAALGAAWLVAWAWREHRRACAKLSPGTAAALLAMAFAATIEAQKRSLPSGGNGVPAETAFAPPPGAATNSSWLARGAYEDWFYLRPTNWWARAADGGWIDALRVFSFCGFQARHEDGSWNACPPAREMIYSYYEIF